MFLIVDYWCMVLVVTSNVIGLEYNMLDAVDGAIKRSVKYCSSGVDHFQYV